MSVRWITWAWEQECSSAGEKLTLIALADHAGEHGVAWPASARLAEKTGQGRSTVLRQLARLEEQGLIRREERHREDGSQTTSLIHLIERGGSQVETGGCLTRDTGGVSPVSAHEPSVNRQNEPSSSLHDADFEVFWETYGKIGPRKVARDCWEKAIKRGATAVQLQVALVRWRDYWSKPGASSIKWPQGWLNNDYWANDPPSLPATKRLSPQEQIYVNMVNRSKS